MRRNKYKFITRLVSIFIIITFLCPNYALGQGTVASPQSAIRNPQSLEYPFIDQLSVPENFGRIEDLYKGNSSKVIIHIRDSHANYEAQTNCAKILESLFNGQLGKGKKIIGIEGAAGDLTALRFRSIPNDNVKKAVSNYFLKNGYLNGAEYFSIFSPEEVCLFGVEEASLYTENLSAFRKVQGLKKDYLDYVDLARGKVDSILGRIFSGQAFSFFIKVRDYYSHKIGLTDYIESLNIYASQSGLSLNKYPAVFGSLRSIKLEKSIHINRVEKERDQLLNELKLVLVEEDFKNILKNALLYRLGKKQAHEFYRYLGTVIQNYGLDRKKYPNLVKYIRLCSLYAFIKPENLFNEIETLENDIKKKIFTSEAEWKADELYKYLRVVENLLQLQLSKDELKYFKKNKKSMGLGSLANEINALLVQFSEPSASVPDFKGADLEVFEKFYDVALERDDAIVANMLNKMDKEGVDIGVLVTGGFHTEGISERLSSKNISYTVISPNITKTHSNELYLDLMMNEMNPFEKMLAHTGTRLSPPATVTVPAGGNALCGTDKRERLCRLLLELTRVMYLAGVKKRTEKAVAQADRRFLKDWLAGVSRIGGLDSNAFMEELERELEVVSSADMHIDPRGDFIWCYFESDGRRIVAVVPMSNAARDNVQEMLQGKEGVSKVEVEMEKERKLSVWFMTEEMLNNEIIPMCQIPFGNEATDNKRVKELLRTLVSVYSRKEDISWLSDFFGLSEYKDWELRIPAFVDLRRLNIEEIEQNLKKINWFWEQSNEDVRKRARARIKLLSDKLEKIMELPTVKRLLARYKVVAIYSPGSYPWHDAPGDIDIHFIVSGEKDFEIEHLTSDEVRTLKIPIGSGRFIDEIGIQVYGEATLRQAVRGEAVKYKEDLRRKVLTLYGNGIQMAGINIFELSKPPIENLMVLSKRLRRIADESTGARKEKRLTEANAIKAKVLEELIKRRNGKKIELSFKVLIDRLKSMPQFKRLAGLLGFTKLDTGMRERLAVIHHDIRTGNLAREVSEFLRQTRHYDLDSDKAEFIGLVHDYTALPFRHLTTMGDLGKEISLYGYNAKEHLVSHLKEDGFILSEDIMGDLLNFDINTKESISDEAKIAIACESVEGAVEDILFGLKLGMFKYEEIPDSIKEVLDLRRWEGVLDARIDNDFDNLVVDIAKGILTFNSASVDEVMERGRTIKERCRKDLLNEKHYKFCTTPGAITKINSIIMPVYQSYFEEYFERFGGDREDFNQRKSAFIYAVNRLVRMTEDEVMAEKDKTLSVSGFERIHAGIERADIGFDNGDRAARGRVVRIDPDKVELRLWYDPEASEYDFSKYAQTSDLAKKFGREFKEFPGKTVRGFVGDDSSGECLFAVNGHQGNFWQANTLLIIDGRIIIKTAPGIGQASHIPLTGTHNFFVLDRGKIGVRTIHLVNDMPQEDISDVNYAISGPLIISKGEYAFESIEKKPVAAVLDGNHVTWDPFTNGFAFSAIGIDKDGNIVQVSMAGDPDQKPEMYLADVAKVMKELGCIDAVLLGGSADTQQYVKGCDTEHLTAKPRQGTTTGKDYKDGRPVGSIIFGVERSADTANQKYIDINNDQDIENLLGELYAFYDDDVIHGRGHIDEVARVIEPVAGELEMTQAERNMLKIAVYGHDIVRGVPDHPLRSAERLEELLKDRLDKNILEQIVDAIKQHSLPVTPNKLCEKCRWNNSKLTQALYDCDKSDLRQERVNAIIMREPTWLDDLMLFTESVTAEFVRDRIRDFLSIDYRNISQKNLSFFWDGLSVVGKDSFVYKWWQGREDRERFPSEFYTELVSGGIDIYMGESLTKEYFLREGWSVISYPGEQLKADGRHVPYYPTVFRLERNGEIRYVITGIDCNRHLYHYLGLLKILGCPVSNIRIYNDFGFDRTGYYKRKLAGRFRGVDFAFLGLDHLISELKDTLAEQGWKEIGNETDQMYKYSIMEKDGRKVILVDIDSMMGHATADFMEELYNQGIKKYVFWGTAFGLKGEEQKLFDRVYFGRAYHFDNKGEMVIEPSNVNSDREGSGDAIGNVHSIFEETESCLEGFLRNGVVAVEMEMFWVMQWAGRHPDAMLDTYINLSEVKGQKVTFGSLDDSEKKEILKPQASEILKSALENVLQLTEAQRDICGNQIRESLKELLEQLSQENLAGMFGDSDIQNNPAELKKVLDKALRSPLEKYFSALLSEGKSETVSHLEPMIYHHICFFAAFAQLVMGNLVYTTDPAKQYQLLRLCEGSEKERFNDNLDMLRGFYNSEYAKWIVAILLHDIGKFRDPANHNIESCNEVDEFGLFEIADKWMEGIGVQQFDEYTKNTIRLAVKYHTHLGLIGSGQWTVRMMAEIVNDELLKNMIAQNPGKEADVIKGVLNDIALITLLDVAAYSMSGIESKGFLRTPVVDLYVEVVDGIVRGIRDGRNIQEVLDVQAKSLTLVKTAVSLSLYDNNLMKHFGKSGDLNAKYKFYIDKFLQAKEEAMQGKIINEDDWNNILDFIAGQEAMGWLDIFVELAWMDGDMRNISEESKINPNLFGYLKFTVQIMDFFSSRKFKRLIVYGIPETWFNRVKDQAGFLNRLLVVIDKFSELIPGDRENRFYLADASGNRTGTGYVEIKDNDLIFVAEDTGAGIGTALGEKSLTDIKYPAAEPRSILLREELDALLSPHEQARAAGYSCAVIIEQQGIKLAEYDSAYKHTKESLNRLDKETGRKLLELLGQMSKDGRVRDGIKYFYIDPLVNQSQLEELIVKGFSSHAVIKVVNGETINIERINIFKAEEKLIERVLSYPQQSITAYKYRDDFSAVGFTRTPTKGIAVPWMTKDDSDGIDPSVNTMYIVMTLMLAGIIREANELGFDVSFNIDGSYSMGTPGLYSDVDISNIYGKPCNALGSIIIKKLLGQWGQCKLDMVRRRFHSAHLPAIEGNGYYTRDLVISRLTEITRKWKDWLFSNGYFSDAELLDQYMALLKGKPLTSILEQNRKHVIDKINTRMQEAREAGKYNVGIVAMEMPLTDKSGKRLKSVGGRGGGQGVYMGDVPWAVSQKKIGSFVFKPLFSADVKESYGTLDKFLEAYNGVHLMNINVPVGGGDVELCVLYVEQEGVPVFLLYDPSEHFFKELYADAETLGGYIEAILLPWAAILIAEGLGIQFELYHFNDWQTAFGPVILKELYKDKQWPLGHPPAALFTTHNLEYQGLFPGEMTAHIDNSLTQYLLYRGILRLSADVRNHFPNTHLIDQDNIMVDLFMLTHLRKELQYDTENGLEFWSEFHGGKIPGRHNLMKGAFLYSDKIVFVSKGHLREAVTLKRGYGLDGVLRRVEHKLTAVFNGIRADKHRPENLSALREDGFVGGKPVDANLLSWKEQNKKALQIKLGLDTSNPKNFVLGIVTRIVKQKGLNVLFTPIYKDGPLLIDALLSIKDTETGARLQFVIEGTAGDPRGKHAADFLKEKAQDERYKDSFRFIEKFDPVLAKQIGAGAEAGIMPSIDEPGGLANQEMALLLTALVVTARGGLNDFYEMGGTTVRTIPGFEIDDDNASVEERMISANAIYEAVKDLFDMYVHRPDEYKQMLEVLAGFNPDWGERVDQYDSVYAEATGSKGQAKTAFDKLTEPANVEDILLYPDPYRADIELDEFDKEHYYWDGNCWRSRDFPRLVLIRGPEDLKKDESAESQEGRGKLKDYGVIRTKYGFSIYHFDDDKWAVYAIREAQERGEIPREDNDFIMLDQHYDYEGENGGYKFSVDETLADWVSAIDRQLNHKTWVNALVAAGIITRYFRAYDAEKFLRDLVWLGEPHRDGPDDIINEAPIKGRVPSVRAGFHKYFDIEGRSRNSRAIIKIDTDAGKAKDIIEFLHRLMRRDNVNPGVLICAYTVDFKDRSRMYGSFEAVQEVSMGVLKINCSVRQIIGSILNYLQKTGLSKQSLPGIPLEGAMDVSDALSKLADMAGQGEKEAEDVLVNLIVKGDGLEGHIRNAVDAIGVDKDGRDKLEDIIRKAGLMKKAEEKSLAELEIISGPQINKGININIIDAHTLINMREAEIRKVIGVLTSDPNSAVAVVVFDKEDEVAVQLIDNERVTIVRAIDIGDRLPEEAAIDKIKREKFAGRDISSASVSVLASLENIMKGKWRVALSRFHYIILNNKSLTTTALLNMYKELPHDIKDTLSQAGLTVDVIKRSTPQEERFEPEKYEKHAITEIEKAA